MTVTPLTEVQRDAMQEITNIAMGQAGSLLATQLGTFIKLSVPKVNILKADEVTDALCNLVDRTIEVTAVRQSFQGFLQGEAIVIYGQDGCSEMADLMGYDESIDHANEIELLFDVSNIVAGACMRGIVDQIKNVTLIHTAEDLHFFPPSLMAERVPVEKLIDTDKLTWTHALLLEVNFTLEGRKFIAHLCVLMPERYIDKVKSIVDEFIAAC